MSGKCHKLLGSTFFWSLSNTSQFAFRMHGWLNACMSLNILTFLQYLHDFVFHINLLSLPAPSLICFKGSPREKWALLFRVSTRKNMKKPNLRLTRPYPLTRFKRRDFWPLPSDFPSSHPNPIWKQCLGVTWCCLNLISSYFVLPNNNIPTPSQS